MVKRELVRLLDENYQDDDEVVFVYDDEEGKTRATSIWSGEHTEMVREGYWEMETEFDSGIYERRELDEILETVTKDFHRFRFVKTGEHQDTKRAIFIS